MRRGRSTPRIAHTTAPLLLPLLLLLAPWRPCPPLAEHGAGAPAGGAPGASSARFGAECGAGGASPCHAPLRWGAAAAAVAVDADGQDIVRVGSAAADPPPAAARGGLSASPSAVDFGVLCCRGQTSVVSVSLANGGAEALRVLRVETAGDGVPPRASIAAEDAFLAVPSLGLREGAVTLTLSLGADAAPPGPGAYERLLRGTLTVTSNHSDPSLSTTTVPYRARVLPGGLVVPAAGLPALLPPLGPLAAGLASDPVEARLRRLLDGPTPFQGTDEVPLSLRATNAFASPVAVSAAALTGPEPCARAFRVLPGGGAAARGAALDPPVRLSYSVVEARRLLQSLGAAGALDACAIELETNLSTRHRVALPVSDGLAAVTAPLASVDGGCLAGGGLHPLEGGRGGDVRVRPMGPERACEGGWGRHPRALGTPPCGAPDPNPPRRAAPPVANLVGDKILHGAYLVDAVDWTLCLPTPTPTPGRR